MNINDLPFASKHGKEALDSGVKFFEENVKDFRGTANFAVVADDGHVANFVNASCHLSKGHSGINNGNRALIATEIGINRAIKGYTKEYPGWRGEDQEVYLPFLKWLTQKSFFSRFIVNSDDFDFIKDYGIIISSDVPSPVVQNLLIITRHFWERSAAAFALFNELTEKYPNAGMLIYHLVFGTTLADIAAKPAYLGHVVPSGDNDTMVYGSASHRAWGLMPTMEELNNLCSGNWGLALVPTAGEHYRNKATIYGGLKLGRNVDEGLNFKTESSQTFVHDLLKNNEEFKEGLVKFRGKDDKPVQIKNPFARPTWGAPPSSPAICSLGEWKDYILPFIMEKELVPSVL